MSDKQAEDDDVLEDHKEIDWMALDLIHRQHTLRAMAAEVLRRWRAGESMSCEVQRRIFLAAFKLERTCRVLDAEFGQGE